MCGLTIRPLGNDEFEVRTDGQTEMVSIRDDQDIAPPYPLNPDQSPGAPVGFGLEILGGASGFSPHQASTGMLLCHHGSYILLDSIPFLDYHLEARGISKNQIRTLILTHLHDDHCSMFPLMLSTRRVEIITTREIFEMAMIKLARGLGWPVKSVARSFSLVEIKPGEMFDFYGLQLVAHVTVHSIPTIGVTAHCSHLGRDYRICLVGDNQSFGEISDMRQAGMLRESTEANLHALYREPFNLLVADGGMGAIHGDPADAMESQAEQVVFVHVDKLPEQFSATFSLASAGKRYTVVDGDPDIFAARAIECIQANFDTPVPGRWLNALLGDKRIVRYNRDDVILKQGSKSRGNVFLVLTGRCDVLFHNGERSCAIGTREAGDFIGEMAAVMGADARNASVVAQTPVTLCEISEATFLSFVTSQGLIDGLRKRWSLRDELARLPVLETLSTTVIEQLARIADRVQLASGERLNAVSDLWYLLLSGEATDAASSLALSLADEGGALPLGAAGWQSLLATTSCELAVLNGAEVAEIIDASPQLSYRLHQYRAVNFNRL
jgi:CRP-like cAMP-binding protein